MYSSFYKQFTVNADVGNFKTEFYWSQWYIDIIILFYYYDVKDNDKQ